MTGFSPKVRAIIIEREDFRCARCGDLGAQIHHRIPRGMGGTRRVYVNQPASGVLLCAACHAWCESRREEARAQGWLLPQGAKPAREPVWYRGAGWVLLDDLGGLNPVAMVGSA